MKPRQILLYVLYFMAAIVFFTFALFPEKQAAMGLSDFFNRTIDAGRFDIGAAGLKFPTGLELTQTEWTGFHSMHIKPDRVTLGLSIPSVFSPLKDMIFSVDINQGKAKGNIRQISFSRHDFSSLSLSFSNTQIREFPFRTDQYQVKLSFDAGGQYEYFKKQNSSKGSMVFLNFTAGLPDNPASDRMGMAKLAFNRVEVEFATENEKVIISKCSARGQDINLDLEGDLSLREGSAIRLKGYFRPNPSFVSKLSAMTSVKDLFQDSNGKGIPVSISGTIHNPVIRFR